ncbi:MAG: type II toxin-antitoxin system VapC family toxin [Deltaproteobacteria bacterium]|nr:type II toxin-antitoxin system VapC family toxin [Deltaproteobacteria bacterium]
MNVVDSSGWLEYFADGPNADIFAPAIENVLELVVSSLSMYEVFKRLLQQRGEEDALQAIGVMAQGLVVDLNMEMAINAAKISVELRLPMADSIILATARAYSATFWTQDAAFQALEGNSRPAEALVAELRATQQKAIKAPRRQKRCPVRRSIRTPVQSSVVRLMRLPRVAQTILEAMT